MKIKLTEHTKAVLLLTAPLIIVRARLDDSKILSPSEYNKIASRLTELGNKPADLLSPQKNSLCTSLNDIVDSQRLEALLDRGLLMSQALDQWQSRGIWIVSRAEPAYPKRLKDKLKKHAPPLIYGCGDPELLNKGGLGIVGSRKVDDRITTFVEDAAMLAVQSGHSVVSGGARGVDQIAMQSALKVEGTVIGALSENLSRSVVASHFREAIKSHSLVLISAVDPNAGFSVGNAMARNKIIYALSDAGLVANADYEKGGTWAGAIEQIKRFKCCPIYVRTSTRTPKGNQALIDRGGLPWPNPNNGDAFRELLKKGLTISAKPVTQEFVFEDKIDPVENSEKSSNACPNSIQSHAKAIREIAETAILGILKIKPLNESELSEQLEINQAQIRIWLKLLLENKKIKKTKSPVKYELNHQVEFL